MDVARGLDKMHSRHIIHLDLKSPKHPSNSWWHR